MSKMLERYKFLKKTKNPKPWVGLQLGKTVENNVSHM
jgi:hypothetical protein